VHILFVVSMTGARETIIMRTFIVAALALAALAIIAVHPSAAEDAHALSVQDCLNIRVALNWLAGIDPTTQRMLPPQFAPKPLKGRGPITAALDLGALDGVARAAERMREDLTRKMLPDLKDGRLPNEGTPEMIALQATPEWQAFKAALDDNFNAPAQVTLGRIREEDLPDSMPILLAKTLLPILILNEAGEGKTEGKGETKPKGDAPAK
jgi:hypothetical protein